MKELYFLKKIDNFIGGIFSCFLIFFKLRKNKNCNFDIVKKILLIKLWGLGNLTIIWPLICKIKEKYPDSMIYFLTLDLNKDFIERHEAIDKIIYFKFTKNICRIIFQFIHLLFTLRKEKIDMVINFETSNNTSALFTYLTHAPKRIGINNGYEKFFYTASVDNIATLHISELYNNLLKKLNIDSIYKYHYFDNLLNEISKIKNVLNLLCGNKFICIHPGTSENFRQKRYSETNFASLVNIIMARYDFPILFTGVKRENYLVKRIISKVNEKKRVFNLVGLLNIWEFIELLKYCFLFVSNDTGPAHLAASLGINTVVFYGPTSPERYRPLNKNSLIFYKNMECSPCISRDKTSRKCRNKCLEFSPLQVFYRISESFFINEKITADL